MNVCVTLVTSQGYSGMYLFSQDYRKLINVSIQIVLQHKFHLGPDYLIPLLNFHIWFILNAFRINKSSNPSP